MEKSEGAIVNLTLPKALRLRPTPKPSFLLLEVNAYPFHQELFLSWSTREVQARLSTRRPHLSCLFPP